METQPTPQQKLREVLARLEVESWQLELLVSGFAIFLVAASFDPIIEYGRSIVVIGNGFSSRFELLMIIPMGLLVCVFFIFVNLLLHLMFRGLWISAIGIRFLSGDIDLDHLRLAKPFNQFLGRRLKSFDRYIENLERISSVIFGFTFLLVFMVLSVVLLVLFAQVCFWGIEWLNPHVNSYYLESIFEGLGLLLIIGALLYFLDFLTLGLFKRKSWIAIWYYPIYRFYGWITLAAMYRPLYYNLIDNAFGRKVTLALVPYMLIALVVISVRANIYQFIPENDQSLHLVPKYYDDERRENRRIEEASIPSRYVGAGFLELFIHNRPKDDDRVIKQKFPKLRPPKKEGFGWLFNSGRVAKEDHSPVDSLLLAVSSLYELRIDDSLYQSPNYFFYRMNSNKQQGLKAIIDIQHLDRGKHLITINKWQARQSDSNDLFLGHYVSFPFWKE